MNQPNSPVISTRAPAAAESPDFLAVLRRYVWLLIGGAVAGAAVSGGLFAYLNKYEPRYTAHFPFQVKNPPPPIGSIEGGTSISMNADDTSRIINKQIMLFDQEYFLNEILKDDGFQKDPDHPDDPNLKSAWMMRYGSDNTKQLREDLRIVPNISAGAFELTMSTRSPMESYTLVKAAAHVFQEHLKEENAGDKATRQTGLQRVLQREEDDFKVKSDALSVWAASKNIDVQRSKFEIEKIALTGLNSDFIKAKAQADSSEAYYLSLKAKREDVEKNGGEIELTPEMEQFLENDPDIRMLGQERLNYVQSRTVEESKGNSANPQNLRDLNARISKIDEQIKETNARLRKVAAKRMEEQAKNRMIGDQTLAQKIDVMRQAKEESVRSLGADLMGYDQRSTDLKEQQNLLNRIRMQSSLADASTVNDDQRIQQMTEPSIPHDVSWPKWYVFIPIGTIAGLGLSTLLAYVLMLTDTRVRTPRDISRTLQLPMLGFVPDEGDDRTLTGEVETAILSSPASMIAESFRQIRSHMTAQTAHNPVNTLLVSSIAPGGGATTVAANLAAAMALNDLRVLLVDANFYRPSLGRIFKNVPAEGLTDAIADPATLVSSIVPHPNLPRLHLLGAGSDPSTASAEIYESKVFRDLVDQLKSRYDLIMFDGAPLSLVSASLVLASRVDGVISVVRAGEVSRGTVARVRDQLRGVHANLLGFVLNAAQTSNTGYFKENYRRFYQYASQAKRQTAGAR